MALTVSVVTRGHLGNKKAVVANVTFDSSYPTGGESFTPADVGLSQFEAVIATPARNGAAAVAVSYDATNKKLFAFETAAAVSTPFAESGNTESLASYVTSVLCIGH